MEVSAHALGRRTSGDRTPGTHCIRGWVGPRAGLNAVEKYYYGMNFNTLCSPRKQEEEDEEHNTNI
jgi:hypothetical protein